MFSLRLEKDNGIAMTVVLVFAMIALTLVGYVLTLSYQQTKLVNAVGIKRSKAFYRAQAGIVDAFWRIRADKAPPGSAGSFATASYAPTYYIDIDTDTASSTPNSATDDIQVSIG